MAALMVSDLKLGLNVLEYVSVHELKFWSSCLKLVPVCDKRGPGTGTAVRKGILLARDEGAADPTQICPTALVLGRRRGSIPKHCVC
jgi:hypothetical protein